MRLSINGEERDVETGITVDSLLDLLGLAGRRVAVELNRDVIARSAWTETVLRDRDRLEIVQFVGGG